MNGPRKPMPGAPVKSRSTTGTDIANHDSSTGIAAKKNSDAGSTGTGTSSSLAKAQQASVNRLYSYKAPGVPQVVSAVHHTRNNTGTSVSNRSLGAAPGSLSQHTSSTTFNTSGQGGASAPVDRPASSQQAAQTKVLNAKAPGNTFTGVTGASG